MDRAKGRFVSEVGAEEESQARSSMNRRTMPGRDVDATECPPLLGLDIGSTSVKATLLQCGCEICTEIIDHEGDIPGALRTALRRCGSNGETQAICTGGSARHRINAPTVIPTQAIEAALAAIGERPDAVVSVGGESIVVYTMRSGAETAAVITGDKCAAGTGEFLRQQLGRMGMDLADMSAIPADIRPQRLSARCSVFMKSDCTHKLNKKEATKEEIAVSLTSLMAAKAAEFLRRARITRGRVVVIGGVTRNRFLLPQLRLQLPEVDFIVPDQAHYFEAFGAAHLAARNKTVLPSPSRLVRESSVSFGRYPPLFDSERSVRRLAAARGQVVTGGGYVLGIDGGSTTTKAALVDMERRVIVAAHYGRTHGDPIAALRQVLREIRRQVREAIGEGAIRIPLAATTGSSREVLGVFVETRDVHNEIIAHTVGATHFQGAIDTIFEIGGQDAKYVSLNNAVPVDYAMNEACSAGTGSFLEESARGDLNILSADEIGPIALRSRGPLKFGEHCSAFINSNIRTAIQEGATREDIVAGLVYSIVSNYLNRVVGNRRIGQTIVLQGGVAKNPAVPAAFAALLGREIVVPPEPELLGAFGVALLALEKRDQDAPAGKSLDLDELIERQITYGEPFTCRACENNCIIQTPHVAGRRYLFGGRCSKYANLLRGRRIDPSRVQNLVNERQRLLFEEHAPDPATLRRRTEKTVGVPRAFTVHSFWPLYAGFFHDLGVPIRLSRESIEEGVRRAEAPFCWPAEIAHGMTAELLRDGVDYLFLPQVVDVQSLEPGVKACFCPIVQGLPYYLRPAFDLPDDRILRPVLSFRDGWEGAETPFATMARSLGFSAEDGRRAYRAGVAKQTAFQSRLHAMGRLFLEQARRDDQVTIAVFGRPYNAFAPEAHLGIPAKFASRGYSVLPVDAFPVSDEPISDNMYWHFGQILLKAARMVREHPNVFVCYITNFGCGPDSFLLHFVRHAMGSKPYLVLELDGHTADAGLDTRIEAFLDIVAGYRRKTSAEPTERRAPRFRANLEKGQACVVDQRTGERISLRDPRVRVLIPSMGRYTSEAAAAALFQNGIQAEAMPPADVNALQLARNLASGKECLPTLLVLGQLLRALRDDPPAAGEIRLLFLTRTTGPCRMGQYGPFYEQTFLDQGIENVACLYPNVENGYKDLGPRFTRDAWHAVVLGDLFADMERALRLTAVEPAIALSKMNEAWDEIVAGMRRGARHARRSLARVASRLTELPRRARLEDVPKILVVGEAYVRRDDFSASELVERLLAMGICPKVSGLGEWIHFVDYLRDRSFNKRRSRELGRIARIMAKLKIKIERLVMQRIERRLVALVAPTGLLAPAPHDMDEIMAGVDDVAHIDFDGEATISTLTARLAVKHGLSGIACLGPFSCMATRLIQSMLDPYCRARGIPFLALECDGAPFPATTVCQLEIFAVNVRRYHERALSEARSDTTTARRD
ncbi:MAG: activase [Vicinamibacteria bacterium]|nr:activase [Vicinamibacteria bacterium]